jgi:hypothetical protein
MLTFQFEQYPSMDAHDGMPFYPVTFAIELPKSGIELCPNLGKLRLGRLGRIHRAQALNAVGLEMVYQSTCNPTRYLNVNVM